MNDDRRTILARRAKLLAATLAGAGLSLGSADCDRDPGRGDAPAASNPGPAASSAPSAAAPPPAASASDAGAEQTDRDASTDADADASTDAGADAQPGAGPDARPDAGDGGPRSPPKKSGSPPRSAQPRCCLSPYDVLAAARCPKT